MHPLACRLHLLPPVIVWPIPRNGRRRKAWVRPRSWRIGAGAVALATVITGCPRPDLDTLAIVDRITLPPGAFTSVHIDLPDAIWLAGAGEIVRMDAAGQEVARISVPEDATAEVIGAHDDRLYFQTPRAILLVDAAESRVVAERQQMAAEAFVADLRGRFVLGTSGAGAVIGHHPESLEPTWGWGAVGAAGAALALSPEGDRVYQAISPADGGEPELLVRDVQTGRIVRRRELADPPVAVVAGGSLTVFVLEADGEGGGGVEALRWRGGELETLWRRSLGDLGIRGSARIRISPDRSRLAVLGLQNDEGLHVLDGETGDKVGRLRGDPLDVRFGPAGEIFLLYRGELTRVE
jgi:hypothetical protein